MRGRKTTYWSGWMTSSGRMSLADDTRRRWVDEHKNAKRVVRGGLVAALLAALLASLLVGLGGAVALAGSGRAWQAPSWAHDNAALVETMREAWDYEMALYPWATPSASSSEAEIATPEEARLGARWLPPASTFVGNAYPDPGPGSWGFQYDSNDVFYANAVEVQTGGATGVQADVYVTPRAQEHEFFWVGMLNKNKAIADGIVFEVAKQLESDGNYHFRPFLHIKYQDGTQFAKIYDGNASGQTNILHGSAITIATNTWNNLKMARNTDGTWNIYWNSSPIEYNLYWPTSPSLYWPRTSWEGMYDSPQIVVNSLGSHHGSIKLRTSSGVWSLWTNSSWGSWKSTDDAAAYVLPPNTPVVKRYPKAQIYYPYGPDFYQWQAWDELGHR